MNYMTYKQPGTLPDDHARLNAWRRVFEVLTPAQQDIWDSLSLAEQDAMYRMTAAELAARLDELTTLAN